MRFSHRGALLSRSVSGPVLIDLLISISGCLREYGWAPKMDSIGDSLSEAQPFLGSVASEKVPDGSFSFVKLPKRVRLQKGNPL